MRDVVCEHVGHTIYVKRSFNNGTFHYGVQCLDCLRIIKTSRHNYRPWIKFHEIPTGVTVHDYIDSGQKHDK